MLPTGSGAQTAPLDDHLEPLCRLVYRAIVLQLQQGAQQTVAHPLHLGRCQHMACVILNTCSSTQHLRSVDTSLRFLVEDSVIKQQLGIWEVS